MITPLRRSGMACVLKGSHSFTCTPRVHPLTEWTFPAKTGTHLPTLEGWKAELVVGVWLVTYRNKCPAPGIEPGYGHHLGTNWARRRLTLLIEACVDGQSVARCSMGWSGLALLAEQKSGRGVISSTRVPQECQIEVNWVGTQPGADSCLTACVCMGAL